MKKLIKHSYSANGHYMGCKEVPIWHSWISLPTIILITASILIGISITIATNGWPQFKHTPSVRITNDLPF